MRLLSLLIRVDVLLCELSAFLLLRSICDLMCVFVIVSVTLYGELLEYEIRTLVEEFVSLVHFRLCLSRKYLR